MTPVVGKGMWTVGWMANGFVVCDAFTWFMAGDPLVGFALLGGALLFGFYWWRLV